MNIYKDDISRITEVLKRELPEIDGVEWHLELFKMDSHGFVQELGVRFSSSFKVPHSKDMQELGANISKKLHEITSNGQVLLELEK